MNIVLLSHTFLPVVGGRELVVHHLALALHRLGHEVRVVVPGGWWKNRGFQSEYRVDRYPNLVKASLRDKNWRSRFREKEMLAQIKWDIRRSGADVIHAHTTYPAGYLGVLARKDLKTRPAFVITPHGADINVIPSIGHGLRMDGEIRDKIGYALAECDVVTAISGGIADVIEHALDEARVARSKIVGVPNGVDVSRFDRDREAARRRVSVRLKVPDGARLIVTVGNYHKRKGQEIAVRAMSEIIKRYPRVFLVIAGRGTQGLQRVVSERGLDEHVHLAGPISQPAGSDYGDDLLADLLAAADVYVAAGIEESAEGMSLAVLEAMAASLPVVATDISGNRDLIADGVYGHVVSPNSASELAEGVLRILRNPEAGRRMAMLCRERALEYSWDRIAKRYVEVYRSATSDIPLRGRVPQMEGR